VDDRPELRHRLRIVAKRIDERLVPPHPLRVEVPLGDARLRLRQHQFESFRPIFERLEELATLCDVLLDTDEVGEPAVLVVDWRHRESRPVRLPLGGNVLEFDGCRSLRLDGLPELCQLFALGRLAL